MNIYLLLSLVFSFALFFILVRETIIDIQTQYVPDNIIYSIYTIAALYVLSMFVFTIIEGVSFVDAGKEILQFSVSGFLFSFGMPFFISVFSALPQLFRRYEKKKGLNKEEKKALKEKQDSIYDVYKCEENPIISKKLKKSIFIITGLLLVVVFAITPQKNYFIIAAILGFALEQLLNIIFKKFYVIEYDFTRDIEVDESIFEDEISVGIGGGDIILFGALGLMFGIQGFMMIFVYSCFGQLFVIITYKIIKKQKGFQIPVPFVPGIALGLLTYIAGLDPYLLNFSTVFELFM